MGTVRLISAWKLFASPNWGPKGGNREEVHIQVLEGEYFCGTFIADNFKEILGWKTAHLSEH